MKMLEPWNDASLLPPPVHTTKCDVDIDIQQLTYICKKIIKILSKQSPLHQEAAICSRFIYKFDKKFRNDIGYRYFKKVNTALRKYLTLNLLRDIENFLLVLPSMDDDEVYLPTKQMLEYVLVRLLAFSKIMMRLYTCSKQGAILYLDRVKRGESHWMSLMPYALLSRVWSMSTVLLQHSCQWYSNFYPFLGKLKSKGLNFLPSDYNLPTNIEEWLNMQELDNFGKFEWSQKKRVEIDQSLVEDEEVVFENILEFVNQINEDIPQDIEMESIEKNIPRTLKKSDGIQISKKVDQGEKISRESLINFFKPEMEKIQHSPDRVTNRETLKQFINNEDKFRNENSTSSLTNHLSFMQWQALKSSMQTLLESLSKNRKIEKKFQKLWKEKCIDYK